MFSIYFSVLNVTLPDLDNKYHGSGSCVVEVEIREALEELRQKLAKVCQGDLDLKDCFFFYGDI